MQEKEKSAGKSQKKSWFQGLKAEFNKIVWTDRNELIKQTIGSLRRSCFSAYSSASWIHLFSKALIF